MARPPVAATSVKSADNLGLDPTTLEVVIAVRRVDGGLLSEEELAAARAALARVAATGERTPRPEGAGLPEEDRS